MIQSKLLVSLFAIYACVLSNTILAENLTLERVQERGYLKCGISANLPGFAIQDQAGNWSGMDIDICQAIAAAIFNSPSKVKFVSLTEDNRFQMLTAGEVDLLASNTTWTYTRDTSMPISFTNIIYYDGQGFLVHKTSGFSKISDLHDVTVCCAENTTTELNIKDYLNQHKIQHVLLTFSDENKAFDNYMSGDCDVYTNDRLVLAMLRLKLPNPDESILLNETISKEPIALAIRDGDGNWQDLIRWIIFGMINAEEMGITKDNLKSMLKSNIPEVQRLLGVKSDLGKYLGIGPDFMVQVLSTAGNYGEMFERNLGSGSKLKLQRDLNNLWTKGGLVYAPPFR